MESSERTLYPSRTNRLKGLIFCAVLVLGGVLLLSSSAIAGWFAIVFFGLCAVGNVVTLVPGSSYLRLTPSGFDVRTLFRTHRETWDRIDSFKVYTNPTSRTRLVGIRFVDAPEPGSATEVARRAARRIGHVDGALPDTYGMSADELAALMNEYLEQSRRT